MEGSSQYSNDPWYQPRYALADGNMNNWELFGGSSVSNGNTWPGMGSPCDLICNLSMQSVYEFGDYRSVTMEIENDVNANEVKFRWSSATMSRECVYSDAFAAGDFVYAIMPDPETDTRDDFYIHSITVTS